VSPVALPTPSVATGSHSPGPHNKVTSMGDSSKLNSIVATRVAFFVILVAAGVGGSMPFGSVGAQTPQADISHAAASTVAATYAPLTPTRIADTRAGSIYPDSGKTLTAAGSLNVQVAGTGAVPSSGVAAVVLNLTAVDPTAASFLTVFPEGSTRPEVSNLNVTPRETVANLVTVPLGSQGGITIYNNTGSADVVVDVEGYYTTTPQSSGLYNPVDPVRVFGTLADGTSIGAGTSDPVTVAGVDGVPSDASAVVANVTVAGSTSSGFVTTFPAPVSGTPTPPPASNVNFAAGQIIANRVIIPVGSDGKIDLYNYTGSVRVDFDLNGYYTGSHGELGSAFTPLNPTRFTDTRVGSNGTEISPTSSETFSFLSGGISVTATALASNVTVIGGTGAGYLTIYPETDLSPPDVSDANFVAGAIVQTFDSAELNRGSIKVFNSSAVPVNVVIDAFGYFSPPPRAVTVTANPTSLAANGAATSALTVTVTTGSGVAFDDPVTLTTTPSVAGSCGAVSATGSTDASGQVTSVYTASNTAGTCTITATEANGGTSGAVVITQT
jgi:hypothetical protein